ncbi:superoxide dismutase family protein [Stakelama sp. CBK3Z-3]|uniref:Superoxide dismutase family protein n=2 Tax=Stakelama flava TaxID=2860338 RepID=A0ABS6XNB9_9SPHN|nr:superoxide dismutase family protein [Stakelama flava]
MAGAFLAMTAAGCSSTMLATSSASQMAGQQAVADLRGPDGGNMGSATATALADGRVRISIDAINLPPGPHGAHIHTVGQCTPPDFTSAGGHWNPTGSHHGVQDPKGPHAGDMPNLLVGTNGQASMAITLPAGTYAGMMDADGAAIVIHSGPDDLRTDPSGNSGSRIACGVFQQS